MPIANLLFKIYGRTSTGIEIDNEELARFVEHVDKDNNGIITYEDWRDSLLLYPHEATIENICHYWKRVCLVDIGEQAVIPEGINKHVNVSKYLIAGGVAGAASRTSTAPLDRLKVVMHVYTKSAQIIPAIKDIWREGRFLGFFREKRDIGAYKPEADSIVQKLVRKLFDEVPQRITISWNAMDVKNHFLELVDDYWPRRTAFKIFDPG